MALASIRLSNAVAYPVAEVPLRWAINALLIWDRITIIWDPSDIVRLRDYTVATPVFLDHGLVEIAKPGGADVTEASRRLGSVLQSRGVPPPMDQEFASSVALHPVKVAGAHWQHVRRAADGFVNVQPEIASLYVGLLAQEVANRQGIPTVCMRYEEPLFLAGAGPAIIDDVTREDCVVRASLRVIDVKLRRERHLLESARAEKACRDITQLRKLDGWRSWREQMCTYIDALSTTKPDAGAIAEIASEMETGVRTYQKQASRLRCGTIGQVGVALAAGVVSVLTGSSLNAIAELAIASAGLGIDLYQSQGQRQEQGSGWQRFVLEARKRGS